MSTAATFTAQDLASHTGKVFDAVRRFGSANIRTSEGETFEVIRKAPAGPAAEVMLAKYQQHADRLRQMGLVQPTAAENERINQVIAGEI